MEAEAEPVEIAFGVPLGQEARFAEILWEAFEEKLVHVFGRREKAIGVFSGNLRDDHVVTAMGDGRLVGVACLAFRGRDCLDIGLVALLRTLGLDILRVATLGIAFIHRARKGEVIIEMLAVDGEERGKGIGRQMVSFIVNFAAAAGYRTLSLYVIDTNHRAKSFYEAMGFRQDRYVSMPFGRLFSLDGAYRMRMELGAGAGITGN